MCWLPFWNLQKHRKKAPPHPKFSSYQLSAILSAFCNLSKGLPRALTWGWNCLPQELLCPHCSSSKEEACPDSILPQPTTPFFFWARKLFWSGLMYMIDILIFYSFNNDSIWFFFHSPHLAGAKRQEDTEHTGEPTLEAPGEVKSLGHSVGSLNQRLIEWFGMEGPLKIILFQLPCCGQEHLPLDEVA